MSKFNTICVQGGYNPGNGDSRVLPLHQSTTYVYDTPEELAKLFDLEASGHIYSRISNPTVAAFEEKVSKLEGGVAAVATASGMSAIATMVLTVAKAGDNIISASQIYGGTHNLFAVTLKKLDIECRFFDQNLDEKEIEKLIDDKTKLIFIESLANPAMEVADLDKFARIAKKHKILFAIDNTLTTPYLLQPIKYGANIVIHSTTKYLDGHASAVGGLIVDAGNFDFVDNARYQDFNEADESYHGLVYAQSCGAAAFAVKARVQVIRDYGMIMAPFNAYITNLGSETLHLRMKRHSENALAVAEKIKNHKNVEWIKYPGIKEDKYHELAKKYFEHEEYSGTFTIGIKGGRKKAEDFLRELKLIKIVTHIADSRTCVLHPASTTHRQLSSEALIKAGIRDNLVRVSVGIEDAEDIVNDILQALDKI